ncbi:MULTISPECIES: hypothetical protein [Actinokineospora]|uniref:Uncharacterized protein n=1 Tax=Actinokineospora fastidiosa TaxID=1816 RepID=A0A918GL43_9PSEU|nr:MULTISPECIES: hypothetical protein [Actinokineospora]UVS77564.1 hypothetical protein Actkin_01277 [Actinokineospora sp. UTMC 2448]GGS42489.1 hypothetical protein GCM10010171_41730 [Actinokineospora fastidiosa]
MSELLLLSIHLDDDADGEPTARTVTVHHPSGRRFVVAEIADTEETESDASIW